MNGRTSEIAKRIENKYDKVKLGNTYYIGGKAYKLTDGNL